MSRQLCEDNDPLDVLVLMQEPVYPMSFLRCGFCIAVLLSVPAVDLVVLIAHLCVAASASASASASDADAVGRVDRAKAIGLMPMIDQGEKDDKIICVALDGTSFSLHCQ